MRNYMHFRGVIRLCSLIMSIVLVFALIPGTYSLAASADRDKEIARVGTGCNMRATPDQDGGWIMAVPTGALVLVCDSECGAYTLVKYGQYEGYIYSACLKYDAGITFDEYAAQFPDMEFEEGDEEEEPEEALSENAASILNEEMSEVMEESDAGNIVNVVTASNSRNAALTAIADDETWQNAAIEASKCYGESLNGVNIRETPSAQSRIVSAIAKGEQFEIIDAGENGFLHIRYGEYEGYVFARGVNYDPNAIGANGSGIINTVVVENIIEADNIAAQNEAEEADDNDERQALATYAAYMMADEISISSVATEGVFAYGNVINNVETTNQSEEAVTVYSEENIVIEDISMMEELSTGATFVEDITQAITSRPTNTSMLNTRTIMRSLPDSASNTIASIAAGTGVKILGASQDGYTMVQYNGLTGYIATNALVDTADINKVGGTPVLFTVTAYCSCRICCGSYSPEVRGGVAHTATGTIPEEGRTIAVDPSIIPYGSHVYIDGYGTYVAEDCGGAVKGNHIDMYFETHSDAIAFGSRRIYVALVQ